MLEITLHVGLPKTGSSTLQRSLFVNRENLRRQGADYPAPDADEFIPKHQYLVRGLMNRDTTRLADTLAAADRPALILSTEGLTNHIYDFSDDSLAEFRNALRGHKVNCVLITREPESWIRSYYKQIIVNPRVKIPGVSFYGTDITLSAFRRHPRIQALTDFAQLQTDIADAYGAQTVRTFRLENQWMDQFTRALNLDTQGWQHTSHENVSAPDACIEILRQVNAHKLNEPSRKVWKAALQEFSRSNHTLLKAASRQVAERAMDRKLDFDILRSIRPEQQPDMHLSSDMLMAFQSFVEDQFAS